MDEQVRRFEELFRQELTGAVSVQLLLRQLTPDVAGALKLAAIPHELDATLLEVMCRRCGDEARPCARHSLASR